MEHESVTCLCKCLTQYLLHYDTDLSANIATKDRITEQRRTMTIARASNNRSRFSSLPISPTSLLKRTHRDHDPSSPELRHKGGFAGKNALVQRDILEVPEVRGSEKLLQFRVL